MKQILHIPRRTFLKGMGTAMALPFLEAMAPSKLLAAQKKDQFVRAMADRMLTYALGRGLEYYDKCALDEITARLAKNDYKFSELVLGIVRSTPFQKRRGDAGTSGE